MLSIEQIQTSINRKISPFMSQMRIFYNQILLNLLQLGIIIFSRHATVDSQKPVIRHVIIILGRLQY